MSYFHHHLELFSSVIAFSLPSTSPMNVDVDIEIYTGCLMPVTRPPTSLVVLVPSRSYFISNSPVAVRHMDILSVIVPVALSEYITWFDFLPCPSFITFLPLFSILGSHGAGVRILANCLLSTPPFPIKPSRIRCFPRPSGPSLDAHAWNHQKVESCARQLWATKIPKGEWWDSFKLASSSQVPVRLGTMVLTCSPEWIIRWASSI